ncbi:MAG TPA: tetratricopeptide repeat protein [Methylomirabilota bacterium]|nr:tetratricopeptide repeat protein [Methylomirabilota bacterium]
MSRVARTLGGAMLALALAGCAELAKQQSATDSTRPASASTAASPSSPPAEASRLNEQVARIASELTELQNAVAKLIATSRAQDDQLAYLRRRVEELESSSRGRPPSAPTGFAPAPPPGPGAPGSPPLLGSATTTPAAELYRRGVEQLKSKETDAAILTFYDLIATYPESPLRESAQYLVADMFFKLKDWRGAQAEFEALIAAVPRGEKVPDALLKVGLCQKDLGDGAKAKRTWERVVREHPTSAAARQARALLRN